MKRHSSKYGTPTIPQGHKVITLRAIGCRIIIDIHNLIISQFRMRAGNRPERPHFQPIKGGIAANGRTEGKVGWY